MNESQSQHSVKPAMPMITEMENEPEKAQRLGMEDGFENSPMAKLV